jgi:hypothetical protein
MVVGDERKFATLDICEKMVCTPNSRLHFEEKWGVVAFMFLKPAACIGNDAVLAIRVDLGKDGPKAPGFFVITQTGIDDEGIGPVAARLVDDGLGAKGTLEF